MKIYQFETGDTVDLAAVDGISALAESNNWSCYKTFSIFLNGSCLTIEIKKDKEFLYKHFKQAWIDHKNLLEKQYLNSANIDF